MDRPEPFWPGSDRRHRGRNAVALGLLVHFLLGGGRATGGDLLVSAVTVWLTNVLVFALVSLLTLVLVAAHAVNVLG
jgi:O-antigen ligase